MQKTPASVEGNPLGTAPVGGLIRKFAIPSIIAMLVNSVYNITDQIFIGHTVGMLGNGATNVAFPVVTFTIALAQMAGIGTAANFNLSLGARDEAAAKRYVGTGLTLAAVFGICYMVLVLLFRDAILQITGATEGVLPYASAYLGITAFGLPFQLFSAAGSVLIRADRSPRYSMLCTVVGAGLNVVLDWLFMFPLQMGIRGAALATVIGQMVSCGLCLRYFFRFKTFKIERSMLGLRGQDVLQIMKLGVSNFLNHLVMTLVNIVLNNTLTHYGALSVYGSDIPLAISGVVAKLNSIMVAFSVGLAQGCQPIWSFNRGARNFERVKETYLKALAVAMAISVCAFALFQLVPRQVISIFGGGTELYFEFGVRYMRIYLMMVCVMGIQPLTVNYFTSVGNVRWGIFLSLARQGLLLVPLVLVLPLFFGLDGLLCAGPIADGLAFLLSVSLMRGEFKKIARAAAEN